MAEAEESIVVTPAEISSMMAFERHADLVRQAERERLISEGQHSGAAQPARDRIRHRYRACWQSLRNQTLNSFRFIDGNRAPQRACSE